MRQIKKILIEKLKETDLSELIIMLAISILISCYGLSILISAISTII